MVPDNTDVIMEDPSFTYDGYQVVRSEFFAHIAEPSVTFKDCKVYVNTACLKRLPHVEYIQFLVNAEKKKLIIRPCEEDDKDSFLWKKTKTDKSSPKYISCRIFFAKIVELMDWNPDYRYKILGNLLNNGEEKLLFFDLTAAETFQRMLKENGKMKQSRTPVFPAEWKNQFGLPVEEHRKQLQIMKFEDYTVFSIGQES